MGGLSTREGQAGEFGNLYFPSSASVHSASVHCVFQGGEQGARAAGAELEIFVVIFLLVFVRNFFAHAFECAPRKQVLLPSSILLARTICKMQKQELEVTVTSAQDLKNVSMLWKMTPYAVAWVEPNIEVHTPIAHKGGVNPTWNAPLKLIVDQQILNQPNAKLHIDIYNHGHFSETVVGSCSVPLSCLKGEEFMSCEVERPSGRTQGTLDFSLKLGDVYQPPAMTARLPQTVEPNDIPPYRAGYPNGYNEAGGNWYTQDPPQYPHQYGQSYPPVMGRPAP